MLNPATGAAAIADDANLDPNLTLQQQRNLATPALPTPTPTPTSPSSLSPSIPPPPPPPTTGVGTGPGGVGVGDSQVRALLGTTPTATPTAPFSAAASTPNFQMQPQDETPSLVGDPNTGAAAVAPPTIPPPPPPPGITGGNTTPSAGGLPAGVTQGTGADVGSFYYNGDKLSMVGGQVLSASGQPVPVSGAALQAAIDAPSFAQQQAKAQSGAQLTAGQNSSSAGMKALYTDPAYLAARDAGYNIGSDGSLIDPKTGATVKPADAKLAAAVTKANKPTGTYTPPPQGPASYLQNGLTVDAKGNPVPGGYNALTDLYRQMGVTPGVVNQRVIDLVKQNPALVNSLPPDQANTLRASLASAGITVPAAGASGQTPAPTGAAPGAVNPGTPSGPPPQIGPNVPVNTSGGGTSATPGGPAPKSTSYTPSDVAIGSTILPNANPRLQALQKLLDQSSSSLAGVDRTKLAQSMFDTFAKSTDPQYEATLRSASQAGAGAGRVGSGMLRTSYGDLANQRNLQLQTEQDRLMQGALEGSIQDQFNKTSALSGLEGQQFGEQTTNEEQLSRERQYQTGLEEQAYQRALEQYQLEQQAANQQFGQGVTLTELGMQGQPPAGTDLTGLFRSLYGGGPAATPAPASAPSSSTRIPNPVYMLPAPPPSTTQLPA